MSPRSVAVVQALVVVFIWSTSFVLTKWAFRYGFEPLTLSGVRFGLAALFLTVLRRTRPRPSSVPRPGRRWIPIGLGLAGYALNTGGYNIGLFYLAPAEVGLLLGLNNTLQVLVWGRLLLKEVPNRVQLLGIAAGMVGLALFYYPAGIALRDPDAIAAVLAAGVGYGLWIVGNRHFVGRQGSLELTRKSMASGAVALVASGLIVEGTPHVATLGWLIVLLLAVVNTAFAFVLWCHTQKLLRSYESVVINSTQTVQVALLSFAFLGDSLDTAAWIAVLIVTAAATTVQIAGKRDPFRSSRAQTHAAEATAEP